MSKCIILPSNVSGVGFWRFYSQVVTFNAFNIPISIDVRTDYPVSSNEYVNCKTVMVQGFTHNQQLSYFKFLLECKKNLPFRIIYNLDDLTYKDDIPIYNRGHAHYQSDEIQNNIKFMLQNSDYIITTTSYLKHRLADRYDVSVDKFKIIPNFIASWWFGHPSLTERMSCFKHRHRKSNGKLKILINGSSSHFSFRDGMEDDFSVISECVKQTADVFEWNIIGSLPWQLKGYERKIKTHQQQPILLYPNLIKQINPDIIVAPLLNNEFNRCKSNIKILEACASLIPILASDISTYQPYLPSKQLFKNSDDLKGKLSDMSMISMERYHSIIRNQLSILQDSKTYEDIAINGFFLENNIRLWSDVFNGFPSEIEAPKLKIPS